MKDTFPKIVPGLLAAGLEDERMDVIWKHAELMTQPPSEDLLIDINSTAFEVPKLAL